MIHSSPISIGAFATLQTSMWLPAMTCRTRNGSRAIGVDWSAAVETDHPFLCAARTCCTGPPRRRAADAERTEQVARRQAFRAYGAPPLVARAVPPSEAAVAQ